MPRWIFIFLGILIVVVALAGIYLYLAVSRPAAAGPFLRTANPQILFGGGESLVTLNENLDSLPTCTPQQRSADIVLVTDISGSMVGDAFDQARAAMENFFRDLDLTVNQVAIVYFADDAVLVQPLTSNSADLQAALSGSATPGGTAIEAGLATAGQELASARRRTLAIPVIVLLSDGGTQDPPIAASTAKQLKDQGVRIVTIALPGRDLDNQFMRELASQPSDAYQTPSTAELAELYRSLAVQINSGLAFNARIQESLDRERVQLVANSLAPAGAVENGNPTWQIGVLTTVTPTFQYRVQTNQLGLVDVSAAGQASLVDCAGLTSSWILPTGPTLLVVPPAWVLLLPLLLLPLLLLGLFRRRTPLAPALIKAPAAEPDIPAIQETPAWLKRLGDTRLALSTETLPLEVDDGDLHNTLIIGIGPAGREVISQVAQKLRSRFGGTIPSQVRLLQIDTALAGTPGDPPPLPNGLEPHQRVLLQPNLQEVENNLRADPQNWQHWKWYENAKSTYERARGRAGLFYDLRNGSQNSELWTHLREQLHNFNSPRVRIVGTTFDDTASGILVDVARLVQIISAGSVFVEYFLTSALDVDWSERLSDRRQRLRPAEQRARMLATVRELERFESNVEVPLIYVPPTNRQAELRASGKGIVQTLYLFEPRSPRPETDLFPCMADTLMALTHQETNAAVNEHLQARRADAGSKINVEGIGMVSALGCFSFQLPGEPLAQAMAWRIVRDALFDEHVGMLPRERTTRTGDYEALQEDEWNVVTSNDRSAYRNEAELLVERHVANYGLESRAFTRAVITRTMDLLNGESDAGTEPVLARRGGLTRARAWVEIVRGFVTQRGERNTARRLTALIQELEAWETWLGDQVYPASQARWRASREQLAQLRQQTGRNWLLDESLELNAYQLQIRPNPNMPPETPDDYFLRVGRRFGWELAYQGEDAWRLRLLVPPADYIWQERSSMEPAAIVLRGDARPLLEQLYALSLPFVRHSDETSLLLRRAESYVPAEWFKHAQPRLAFDQLAASNIMGSVRQISLLLTPRGLPTQQLEVNLETASAAVSAEPRITSPTRQAMDAAPRSPTFRVLHTNDATSVTLLRVIDWIPLPVAAAFNAAQWERNPVEPSLYVWTAEQEAARLEAKGADLYAEIRANHQTDFYAQADDAPQLKVKGDLLSPRFVSWLGKDQQLLQLFGQAYLYQLWNETEEGMELPGIGIVEGSSFGAVLENLIEHPSERFVQQRQEALSELEAAIQNARQQIADDPDLGVAAYLRQTIETAVTPLLMGNDARAQDFARYLLGLIANEM